VSETKYQYRVVSRRQDCATKYKVYATRKGAENRLGLLISDEPWKFLPLSVFNPTHDDPDKPQCCDGWQCGCEGVTYREAAKELRDNLPPLVECWIEKRPVGEWEPHDRDTQGDNHD